MAGSDELAVPQALVDKVITARLARQREKYERRIAYLEAMRYYNAEVGPEARRRERAARQRERSI